MRQVSFLTGVEPEQTSFLPATPPQSTRERIAEMARLKDAKRNNRLPSDAAPVYDPQVDIEAAIARAKR